MYKTEGPAVERASRIKLLAMDCDGVLTDGSIILSSGGEDIKRFHSRDGQGLTLAKAAGLRTAIISGRSSKALEYRARELGIDFLVQQSSDKLVELIRILELAGVSAQEAAFIGDDLPDLPAMRYVGLAIAVRDAVDEVKAAAHIITSKSGGQGAVRESIEFILKARLLWNSVTDRYSGGTAR
ncbi:MAG: HAD hydrolase family protein [Acidobacteriota bacterium]|nr:HAD hydrolase family protein [Blastocatellia bacterium]MDW8412493.1 HAD hydrolase family protein [Acidobacteriota bacterium]